MMDNAMYAIVLWPTPSALLLTITMLNVQWAADAAVLRPPEEEAEPWPAPQAAVSPQAPA